MIIKTKFEVGQKVYVGYLTPMPNSRILISGPVLIDRIGISLSRFDCDPQTIKTVPRIEYTINGISGLGLGGSFEERHVHATLEDATAYCKHELYTPSWAGFPPLKTKKKK